MSKEKFVRYHINKINYKGEGDKYFVVGYNAGGIGTPLHNVDEDVKWFIAQAKQRIFDGIEKLVKDNPDVPCILWVKDFHTKKHKMCISAIKDYWDFKEKELPQINVL